MSDPRKLAAAARPRADTPRRSPHLNLLLLAALPLLLWLLNGTGAMRLAALMQVLLLIAAMRLIARGERLHRAWALSHETRPPRVPRKIVGAVLIGCAVMLMAGYRFEALTMPALLGFLACVLTLLAFGTDPLRPRPAAEVRPTGCSGSLLTRFETGLAESEARIALLEAPALLQATTAFADHAATRLHRIAGCDRAQLTALQPRLDRLHQMLLQEVARLEQGDRGPFAQRRYTMKLTVMREALDTWIAGPDGDTCATGGAWIDAAPAGRRQAHAAVRTGLRADTGGLAA